MGRHDADRLSVRQLRVPSPFARPAGLLLALLLGAAVPLCPPAAAAQQPGATVLGTVTERGTGRPVDGAVVRVEGTDLGALTDEEGRYRIPDVPPGPQVLRVDRIGFATVRVSVTVPARGTLSRDIRVAERALEMEEITVTADAVGRAREELGTASVIELEAIKAQTATSLRGVLELVPGVPLEPPGLDGVEQLALRSAPTSGRSAAFGGIGAQTLASFGTLIVVDGVPMSNNANLQTTGPRGDLSFTTSAGGGVDLRKIPANTIERVEVIRGVPSVRWGDLTQGAVIVDTRAGVVPAELQGQLDARTAEGAAVWGESFGGPNHTGTLVFDAARTRIRPGVADDDAVRLAGQLSHRIAWGGEAGEALGTRDVVLDSRVDFFRLAQDLPRNPNIRLDRSETTREWGLRVTEQARVRLGESARLSLTGNYTRVSQNAFLEADRVRGAVPFTDRLEEGRQEGFYLVAPYLAELETDGEPQLLFGRLELEAGSDLLGLDHRLRVGVEPRSEWNAGEGRLFDVARPMQVTFTGVRGFDRPRDFDGVGSLATTGLYAGDRVRARLGEASLEVQGGLRLDLLHDGGTPFSGVRDAVLQPRVNLQVTPLPWLRLRAGAGRLAKSPTLGQLYPAPQYYDLVNVNQFTEDPAERLAVLTTFIQDPANPDVGFIEATKAEAGIEVGVGDAAFSFVAFRDRIEGGIAVRPEPDFLLRERFALTDSIIGNGIKPEIIEPAIGADTVPILIDRPANVVDQENEGFELVASLPEWERLKTRLQVTGAWVRTEQIRHALDVGPRNQFQNFQLRPSDPRHPFWDPAVEFGETALLTYRLIHHQPDAGLVITATVQHNIHDEIEDRAATDTLAFAGYMTRTGELVEVPPEERTRPEFQDLRVPRGGTLIEPASTPADYVMSVQVSKTLPLDGRLNFWAFNVMDNRGIFADPEVLPRIYPATRFGLEVSVPVEGLLPGGG